ncbi:MAG TPA: NUMOD1 domain-containing DNA-binding protein [Niabella sp.]|nr:NUMOD1 domain-containing DNA-binding protein [Niabella sp.]
MNDKTIVILTKDHNGLNIKPSNLTEASISQKQKRISELNRRKPLVVDEKARHKAIENSRLTNSKPVTQYDLNGKKIKTFPSIAIAARATGISHSHISNRARGIEHSAGGFIWRQGKARKIDLTPMLEKIAQRKRRNKEVFGKKVSQYNMKGKRLAVFPTINDAAKATGINNAQISLVIKKIRSSAGGFFWKKGYGPLRIDLSGYEYGQALSAKKRQRPVMQYSMEGKPLRKFAGIKEAAFAVGVHSTSIIGALRGKQETSAGYKWKYLR